MLMHLYVVRFSLAGIKSLSSSFLFSVQINLGLYMQDNSSEFSVLVDRSVGGSSIVDGQLELMLHRSRLLFLLIMFIFFSIVLSIFILYGTSIFNLLIFIHQCSSIFSLLFFFPNRRLLFDDARGVGEALNETVCVLEDCRGLTVSTN